MIKENVLFVTYKLSGNKNDKTDCSALYSGHGAASVQAVWYSVFTKKIGLLENRRHRHSHHDGDDDAPAIKKPPETIPTAIG